MNKGLIALALMGLLGAFGVGCSSTPCEELADEAEAGGCAAEGSEDASEEAECSGDVEKEAQCYLDNTEDVCAPSADELTKIGECIAG